MTTAAKKRVKGARERILEKAQELFYIQGFRNTGINQIIEESGTAKASFYQYFKSKDDLAISYLKYYEAHIVNAMNRLMKKYPGVTDFFRAWTKVLSRDIKYMRIFNGCPFANFASQLESGEKTSVAHEVNNIMQRMYDNLENYFKDRISAGELKTKQDPRILAKRVLHVYEGGMMMAKITDDMTYIHDLETMFLKVID